VRLDRGLRGGSWVNCVALLFALLALGTAVPLDVLGLDELIPGDELADNPIVAGIVQVRVIDLSGGRLPSILSSRSLPSLARPAVLEGRRTVAGTPSRLSSPQYFRIFPRAHIRREASRTSLSTTEPYSVLAG
jgi:hypothetical protein